MNEKENPDIEMLEDEQAEETTGGKLQQFPRLDVPIICDPVPIRIPVDTMRPLPDTTPASKTLLDGLSKAVNRRLKKGKRPFNRSF